MSDSGTIFAVLPVLATVPLCAQDRELPHLNHAGEQR